MEFFLCLVIFCAGNEERRRGAEDETKSDFERAAWYDCQLGEYFNSFKFCSWIFSPYFVPVMLHHVSGDCWRGKCDQWRVGPACRLLGKNQIFGSISLRTVFQKLEEGEYKFSEAVKLDSYVNILCTGSTQAYYAGGKSGYLVKISRS